jgi:hypothetical protein
VIWTRQYIVAAVAGTPDAEAAATRLLANQEDIGNAIVPLYGKEAGAALTELLKSHILIAVDLVAAAIAGDKRAFRRHDKRWDDNADEIAAFLASANPNWPEADVRDLLGQHLALTKSEAVARLEENWDADVAAFDDIFTEILTMADALSGGIVKQFPDRFHHRRADTVAANGDQTWALRAAMRKLWSDHVIWTRQYIVAAVAGRPDAKAAAERLLHNQEDIGNAIVPLYGMEAAVKLTDLLKSHILIAVDLVDAVIADDERRFRREDRRWQDNADEIAAFLAGANPNWPEETVQDLLDQHLSLTKQELIARFGEEKEDWERDVAAFDDIFTEILTVADALADGLIAQFPDRFARPAPSQVSAEARAGGEGAPTAEALSLQAAMRKLWSDHVIWTRQYIVAAVAGTPDAEAAATRLLANQEDIGNAIVPLYGKEAGAALTELLKSHILIAVDLVAAAIAGDKRAFRRHDKRWDDNADEIAAFLASANPNWAEADVRDLLGQHLALTKGEAVARLEENWDADVTAFDDIFTEILTMADALSGGIVKQFPDRFGENGGPVAAAKGEAPCAQEPVPAGSRPRRRGPRYLT